MTQYQSLLKETAAARAELALELGGMGSFVWDLDTGMAVGDAQVGRLFGVSDPTVPKPANEFLASVHPHDLPLLQRSVDNAVETGSDYDAEFRIIDADSDVVRWVAGKGRVRSAGETGRQLVGVNWDITRSKRSEAELKLLAREMNHRVKNTFAVIQALVSLGARGVDGADEFANTLKSQIRAMADAHLMAVRFDKTSPLEGDALVTIGEVVKMALAAWLPGGRVTINDEGARIEAKKLSNLAMLVYELTTNATKYGPLGEQIGSLTVDILNREDHTLLRWTEDLPPPVAVEMSQHEREAGVQAGFGSILMQHCASALRGKLIRDMRPEGLRIELRIPTAASSRSG